MARLVGTSRDAEEYARATVQARRRREETAANVAEQIRALIIEGDQMASRSVVAERIRQIVAAERKVDEARGRQAQAAENGMPVQCHRDAETESREVLRGAVMRLAVAAGAWVAALDAEIVPTAR